MYDYWSHKYSRPGRFGNPGALNHVKFSIRDINAQVYDTLGMKIHASTAKSHIEQGRVERRIRTVKDLIERMGIQI